MDKAEKIDLMIEKGEMADLYFSDDPDFKHYVDSNMMTYGRKLADELESPITREYYRSLQKGGCNERHRKKDG
jgi:hypothetical protein